MARSVKPEAAVRRYGQCLSSQPLAERSKREYRRNAEAFCTWLADAGDGDWGGDPLADRLARDYAARDFKRFLKVERGVATGVGEPGVGVAGFAVSVSGAGLAERAA